MPAVALRGGLALLVLALAASCSGPAPATPPLGETTAPISIVVTPGQPVSKPPALPVPATIRFALVGDPQRVNAWSLFDESGASYANYVLRYAEYPSLYRLSIPAREFEPYIADGQPSGITTEDQLYTGTVKLPSGLYWSNGTPLTAEDVAFTANTALAFRLRLDWLTAYDPDYLDHVEASDHQTVKFVFKQPLNAGIWQYGVLQGPILSRNYWSSLVAVPAGLLPTQELVDSWQKTRAEAAELQARIDADNAQLISGVLATQSRNEIDVRIRRNQDELNSLNTRNARLQDEFNQALDQARQALFDLPDEGEPVFGPYLRYEGSGETFTRLANPSYPFTAPAFSTVLYQRFQDEQAAMDAFEQKRVDVVLAQEGVSRQANTSLFAGSSATFLAFNPARPQAADPALHRALACILDPHSLAGEGARSISSLVPDGPWSDTGSLLPCAGMSAELRLQAAARMLGESGYTWRLDPSGGPGAMLAPDGEPLAPMSLETLSQEVDPLRYQAAEYIAEQARPLGLSLTVHGLDRPGLRYAVYSTRDYDLAILGWRPAEYPAYLCQWFLSPGPFAFRDDRLQAGCQGMSSTADLPTAMQAAREVQSVSMEYLPLIPLYASLQYEAIQNVDYPFQAVTGGISGLYGAPDLAIPSN